MPAQQPQITAITTGFKSISPILKQFGEFAQYLLKDKGETQTQDERMGWGNTMENKSAYQPDLSTEFSDFNPQEDDFVTIDGDGNDGNNYGTRVYEVGK